MIEFLYQRQFCHVSTPCFSQYYNSKFKCLYSCGIYLGAEDNFAIYNHGVIDSMNFPYDYNSATHYHNTEFTKNGRDTLQSIDQPKQKLGNDYGMSKIDIKKIWQYYKCYKKRTKPHKGKHKQKAQMQS